MNQTEAESVKRLARHKVCSYCGSKNIKEIKPLWGICFDCEGNFHMIAKTLKNSRKPQIKENPIRPHDFM